MDTKALRQKILDLAIRGKLVPQDPNDEPASVLLERIREQKKQMVKEGKLKAKDIKNDTIIFLGEDNLHYEKFQDGTLKCIEDEIPFELPEGWEWTRLGSLFSTITGSTPSTKDSSLYGDEYPFYKPTDLDAGFDVHFSEDTVSEKGYKSGRILPVYSVLVTCIGATIGKTGYIRNSGICNQQINAILPNTFILPEYTYFCMCSEFEQQQIWTNSSATTLPILNKSKFDSLFFPVPPKAQQIRTVERIKDLLHFVEIIQQEKISLQETIKLTKSKILDLAIRGKLVPQDPDDEPASVLLERIRAEKEELIKQGKIKRDKKESIIFRGDDNSYYRYKNGKAVCIDNDLPYELPDGWMWAMLPDVVLFQEGPGILKKDFRTEGIPLIRISGLQTDEVLLDGCDYLDPIMVETKWKHFKLELGDVILCTSASIGKASIVGPEAVGAIPYTGQIRFKMTQALIREYFLYFANSNTYLNQINRMKTGNCIQHYGPTHLKDVYIPLPPIKEQEQIIKQISSLLSSIHVVEENITM